VEGIFHASDAEIPTGASLSRSAHHPDITEFEQVVREYKLSPDQYLRSIACASGPPQQKFK